MLQFVYSDRLYIIGKPGEIINQLKALQSRYKTVKEFLQEKSVNFGQ